MRIWNPGKILDNLWYLGHEESGIYLLDGGDEAMIISGGIRYIVPAVLRQFEEFSINEKKIAKLVILHSHFDHVGIVPFFKRRHPDMEIYGSARAWKILGMQNAIDTINEFSRAVTENMGMAGKCSGYDLDWRDDVSGTALSEGDRIAVGDMELHIIETPGHSSCSISAYDPQHKVLFPSDGGGIPYKGTIIPSGNSNFTAFQQSLEKLKDLEADYVCADHYGYVTGDEARNFISNTIEAARKHRTEMEEAYRRTGDIDGSAEELTDSFYAENPDYFISREILEGVYRQMVRHIAKELEGH
ncbi:MAG: MBL fold metallo-hydrolase [Proteobacteria bacterium]|nr:MBL fold metallo-hydrolase [Pseudomonadota bacterium]